MRIVLSSSYARAWRTAELLEEEARWPAPEPCAALEASCVPADALAALAERADADSVALVGHEPTLSQLASLLLGGDSRVGLELKKGGVVHVSFAGRPAPGAALLRWSVSPKILRALDPG